MSRFLLLVQCTLLGGTAALYDLDVDPGEAPDMLGRFPKVAAQMAAECRRRWDEIIASGRSFAAPSSPTEARKAKGKAPRS